MSRRLVVLGATGALLALRSLLAAAAAFAALPIDFDHYHTPAEVDQILGDLETAFPQLCQRGALGTTAEGRPIPVLKISDEVAKDDPQEDDIVFIALQHGREWITVETALFLAETLLTRYGSDPAVTADVDSLEIWILPVANPDGFAYTHAAGGDRYWRKNRRPSAATVAAIGVDVNRNFGFQWSAGTTPSSETYAGAVPFSEVETAGLRDFLAGLDHLEAIVNYHSFGARFLRPWAYTGNDPPGVELLDAVQNRSLGQLAQPPGPTWVSTHAWSSLPGVTQDWVWNLYRIAPLTVELPPSFCSPAGSGCSPTGKILGFGPSYSEVVASNAESLPVALDLIHDAAGPEVRIRDHAADTGDEPSAVWLGTHWSTPFWKSPDIRTQPSTWGPGAQIQVQIVVHNDSAQQRDGVRVDAYYSAPQITAQVPGPSAKPIGNAVVNVPAASTVAVTLPWTVPTTANNQGNHAWSIGAVVSHSVDLPLTTRPQDSSNTALYSVQTVSFGAGRPFLIAVTNTLGVLAELVVEVPQDSLPPGWRAWLPSLEQRTTQPPSTPEERKARLLGATGPLIPPGRTLYLPLRIDRPEREAERFDFVDVDVHGVLLPVVAGSRRAMGGGITYRLVMRP